MNTLEALENTDKERSKKNKHDNITPNSNNNNNNKEKRRKESYLRKETLRDVLYYFYQNGLPRRTDLEFINECFVVFFIRLCYISCCGISVKKKKISLDLKRSSILTLNLLKPGRFLSHLVIVTIVLSHKDVRLPFLSLGTTHISCKYQ